MPPHPFHSLPLARQLTIELGVLDGLQDLGKPWPRSETQFEEVVARDQPGGANLFLRRLFQKSTDEVMRPQIAMARQAIQPVQFEMFRKSRKPYKARSEERRVGKECRSRWSP